MSFDPQIKKIRGDLTLHEFEKKLSDFGKKFGIAGSVQYSQLERIERGHKNPSHALMNLLIQYHYFWTGEKIDPYPLESRISGLTRNKDKKKGEENNIKKMKIQAG